MQSSATNQENQMKFAKGRNWIEHIDDERDLDNGIIVTLKDGWFFKDDPRCGVRGFDTISEAKEGTAKTEVYEAA
jgi:hypothetical protein